LYLVVVVLVLLVVVVLAEQKYFHHYQFHLQELLSQSEVVEQLLVHALQMV
tara:strand:- start:472 stop:624 length:153 start_codon:yes stop_codon:yes gene_type:complete